VRWRWNVLFDDRHYEWLAARIRELPLTPVEAGSAPPLTIRDTLARKLARDSQAEIHTSISQNFSRPVALLLSVSNGKLRAGSAQTAVQGNRQQHHAFRGN